MQTWRRAYVGLGSNLGDPVAHVLRAVEDLVGVPASCVRARSSLYRSAPLGPADQPEYVNAVVAMDTALEPLALLDELLAIERRHGRTRGPQRWGPRTLDLDLLLLGELRLEHERLTLPHPGIAERAFVLYPLQELAPELRVPGLGALRDLIAACPPLRIERLPSGG